MNILVIVKVVENMLAWKLAQSERCETVFSAGNGGTKLKTSVKTQILKQRFCSIKKFIAEKGIGLVVVGPEDPLVKGIKDYLSDTDV